MTLEDPLESAKQSGEIPEPADGPSAEPRDADARPAGPEALAAVFKHLAEAIEYLAYLLATQVDRVKLKVRHYVVLTVLGLIALVAVLAVVFCTVWLLLSGVAGSIGALLGDRPWMGSIVTAAVILMVTVPGVWIFYRRWLAGELKSVHRRYQARQAEQKARFGREMQETAEKPLDK